MEAALLAASSPTSVVINAERPRKGVFEVRVSGTPIITTGPEPRPFPLLKAIDVDAIADATARAAAAAAAADEEQQPSS